MRPGITRAGLPALALLAVAGAPAAPPDLSGRWARLEVTTALSDVPVVGDITSETRAISIVDVRKTASGYEVTERVCALANDSLGGAVRARFPRAFLRAVSGASAPARLAADEGRLRYEESRPVRVRGAALEDPSREALPTAPSDPRLVDADEDGQPGLTVQVEGLVKGEIYVVQRDESALEGAVLAPDRIAGLVRWKAEQVVLGASRDVLAGNPDNRPHPEPGRSYFRMRRVPARATCPEVIRRASTLFR
ncbi:MAG: hypothetical protein KC933_06035 [Myxococcales bacterium]|nr:hypothetical protein [Myxococcales bacterium]MCB9648519.1 hypothetical protein [Deltaproteobacteria bacterium]